MKKSLTILGATGSIGLNTLDLLARHPDRYEVFALTAHRDVGQLASLCERFSPRYAVISDAQASYQELKDKLKKLPVEPLLGMEALEQVASDEGCDTVVAGIVGIAGLRPCLAAAAAGKTILLANKEALVVAGPLFIDTARRAAARIVPVDSEHNAVFQCTHGGLLPIQTIFLTASGGPFLRWPMGAMAQATPQQACAHPTWKMGRKISVDSATMMNKGLEVIEAQWLFSLDAEQVKIIIHPQSIVHALVELKDGGMLAHLARSDMRVAIAGALAWPERIPSGAEPLDLPGLGKLEFEPLDGRRFPCVALAAQAMASGGSALIALNAANEAAVEAFLRNRLSFNGIAEVIARTLEQISAASCDDLDTILALHDAAYAAANGMVKRVSS